MVISVSDGKLNVFDGLVTHEMNIPKRKDIYLNCDCGSELFRVSKWENEPDEIYLTLYSYQSDRYSFWERLSILFGGKTKTAEIILSRKELDKLKKF